MAASPMPFGFSPAPQITAEDILRLLSPSALGAPQGFAGSTGVTLPGQAQPAPGPIPAQAAPMTVPLPPRRPASFGFTPPAADVPAADAVPAMALPAPGPAPAPAAPQAGAAPAAAGAPAGAPEASGWERVGRFFGDNSDLFLSLGAGLLSTGSVGQGIGAGLRLHQDGRARQAATDLARAEHGLKVRKLAQQAQADNLTAKSISARLKIPYDQAVALAANNEFVNGFFRSNFGAPEGWQRGEDGSFVPVRGGPQDPETLRARAQAHAEGAAAGKPDEIVSLIPEQERVGLGLPAGSYQRDSKGRISPVNPTGTTINMGSERAQDAKVGQGYGEYQLDLATKGRNAGSTLNTLALMEQAMKLPGFYSGVGGEGIKRANQVLGLLGVKDAKAASAAEVFDALSNRVVLDGLGGSLGPGISNTDRDYISRTAPTLSQSEEGNRALIGVARSLAQRQQAVSKLARDYAAANGGRIDGGFDQRLDEFAAANPLFPTAREGATAVPPQEPPRGAPTGTRMAPDGRFYAPDPSRPGKYLQVR